MKISGFRLAAVVVSLAFLGLVYLLILLSAPERVQAATPTPPDLPTHPSTSPSTRYALAAQALRSGDLQTAGHILEDVARRWPDESARAGLLSGFYAWEAGDEGRAETILAAQPGSGGDLEDWRLWLLAESALHRGGPDETALARATLDRLLDGCRRSPLRPQAYLEAARLADRTGDERRALSLIDGARAEKVRGEIAVELENLAWQIGQRLGDDDIRREAARRLLVRAPLAAGALDVASTFRSVDGSLDWSLVLSSGEVKQRARSFLDVDRMTAAIDTLDNVPLADRDTEWHLIKARALTESRRGGDALSVLSALDPQDPAERASLEWERAVATAELASSEPSSIERRAILEASHRHLTNMVRLGADAQISGKELRLLYHDFLDAGLLEQAVDALRILRRIDPADVTGASDLWELGWRAYRGHNFGSAIAYWRELADVYPGQPDAQRGLYWQARALEQMGSLDSARALYRGLVAASDTVDFYRRQAAERLGVPPVSSAIGLARSESAQRPWPADPALRRAKRLTDLGLDKLATRELDLVASQANARDLLALRALVMGRQGNRRGSIALLREAFPALGGSRQSTVPEEILRAYYPLEFADTIRAEAQANRLPGALIAGIIRQESAFDPRATSPVGARGLMQLMPQTARELSSHLGLRSPTAGLYDPDYSIALGAAYISQLLRSFGGNTELALAGYNGGPNRIRRLWQEAGPRAELDSFLETLNLNESRDYVKRILVLADSYRQLYPGIG